MADNAPHHLTPHDDDWFRHSRAEGAPQAAHGELHPVAITLSLVAMFVLVLGLVIALMWYFNVESQKIVSAASEEDLGLATAEQLARDRTTLSGFGWVDREAGLAQVPIESAMRYVVAAYDENPAR